MKNKFTLITALMLCAFLLSACNGGCGGESSSQSTDFKSKSDIVSEWNLPPAPDPILNAATIEGVDSDNDMVRDDIQREMAFAAYPNETEYKMYTKATSLVHQANQAYSKGDFEKAAQAYKEVSLILECSSEFFGFNLNNQGILIDLLYDTSARDDISLEIDKYTPMNYYNREILNKLCPAFSNGGTGDFKSQSKIDIESEWNLPPEPDPILNAATVEGVDSDSDMVRDDIQRKMAFVTYPNEKEYKMYTKATKLLRQVNQSYSEGDFEKVVQADKEFSVILACSTRYFGFSLDNKGKLIDLLYDTAARDDISLEIEKYTPIHYYSKEDLNNLCPALAE